MNIIKKAKKQLASLQATKLFKEIKKECGWTHEIDVTNSCVTFIKNEDKNNYFFSVRYHKGDNVADLIEGIESYAENYTAEDYAKELEFIRENCNIDAIPNRNKLIKDGKAMKEQLKDLYNYLNDSYVIVKN